MIGMYVLLLVIPSVVSIAAIVYLLKVLWDVRHWL